MPYTSFISAGIQKERTEARNQLSGGFEVFLYNPTWEPCDTRMTIYFEGREPHTLEKPIHIPPKWSFLQVAGNTAPDVMRDAGFWGARYESSVPMIPILISFTGGFGGEGLDASLTGGVTHFLGTDLATLWTLPNSIWRTRPGGVDSNPLAPPPFNEFEVIYLLNPGPRDAHVTLALQYRNLPAAAVELAVGAERVLAWRNDGQVAANEPHAVRITSSEPLSTSAVRYLHDPAGPAEKGVFVRCGMPAVPGPINE